MVQVACGMPWSVDEEESLAARKQTIEFVPCMSMGSHLDFFFLHGEEIMR